MITNRRVFLKQAGAGVLGTGLLATLPAQLFAQGTKKITLPRSTPEQQGVSSAGIQSFLDAIEKSKIEFHSIMVVRHGNVLAEGWWAPYAPELKHTLYSLSKSFTSTAVGLAIQEKRFTLESPVTSFFPKDLPAEKSDNLSQMKVKHLLTMSTGHAKDTIPALRNGSYATWEKGFFDQPVDHVPGTKFVYNTGATYMLASLVEKTTKQPLMKYLGPKLFAPLGIEGMDWESNAQGITVGGFGLRVRTEDIAKFGQLYLQKGKWNNKQLIPAAWVEDALASHVASNPSVAKLPKEEDDWAQGYGYQFWRCTHGAVRGDGAFGQFCIMMPDKDAVVVITGESFDLQASIRLVWDHLYPAMNESAPADPATLAALQQRLKSLGYEPPKANVRSPLSDALLGKQFTLEANTFGAKNVVFMPGNDLLIFSVTDETGEHRLMCGLNKWFEEKNAKTQAFFPIAGRPVVTTAIMASATWTDDSTLLITWRWTETAHSDSMTCTFAGNSVSIKFLSSVARGNPNAPDARPIIVGKA